MPVRVAINGFGRIGRCLARVIFSGQKEVELIAINSRGDLESAALLFKYDSIHGTFSGSVAARSREPDDQRPGSPHHSFG